MIGVAVISGLTAVVGLLPTAIETGGNWTAAVILGRAVGRFELVSEPPQAPNSKESSNSKTAPDPRRFG
jgi:hypothetical protein